MNEQEIRRIVERVLAQMQKEGADAGAEQETPLPDLAQIDLRTWYLVDDPQDREAFLALKEKTPARLGVGHAGARYRTETMLRFQADHTAAQSAVFSDVREVFVQSLSLRTFQTLCQSRGEFLTRPDKGRAFAPDVLQDIARHAKDKPRAVVYLADGLSSSAVVSNAGDILPVVLDGLRAEGVSCAEPFFVKYGRVATQDMIGEATGADVVCVLLGERPGLVTANSMSAYLAYRPTVGMPESRRTVVANIHSGGTPCVEAGAHIVDLIRLMLEKQKSGIELPV